MALVACPECARQVSTRAAACPGCGCPVAAVAGDALEQPLPVGASVESPRPSHEREDFGGPLSAAAAADDAPATAQPAATAPNGDGDDVGRASASPAPGARTRGTRQAFISEVDLAWWRGAGVLPWSWWLSCLAGKPGARQETECAAAIHAYYDALGWEVQDMTFRVSIGESIASCRKSGSLAAVLCFRKSKAPFRECHDLSGVEMESLDQGAYCFDVVDNETGTRWPGACAFSWQACEGRRTKAIVGAYGARSGGRTFEKCTTRPVLFGIQNLDAEGNWYYLSPPQMSATRAGGT